MKTSWMGLLTGLAGLLTTVAYAAGDPEVGATRAVTCIACHGQDGNSVNGEWPKLAGQHEQYSVRQLKLFKSGERENAVMLGMSIALSEQDMADISAFYAAQQIKPGIADESLVRLGQRVYRAGNAASGVPACMACHGPSGAGNPGSAYPALGGQHSQYTAAKLREFRAGTVWGKGANANAVMRTVAAAMTDAEIDAVASYLEGLH